LALTGSTKLNPFFGVAGFCLTSPDKNISNNFRSLHFIGSSGMRIALVSAKKVHREGFEIFFPKGGGSIMFEDIIRQLPKYRHLSCALPLDSNDGSVSDANCSSPDYFEDSFGDMTEEDIVFLNAIGICTSKTDDLVISAR
jgi:hypothetical protein